MELILDDKKIEVKPFSLVYEVEGTEESELSVRIENKKDRDYVFTHCIRNKIMERKTHGTI